MTPGNRSVAPPVRSSTRTWNPVAPSTPVQVAVGRSVPRVPDGLVTVGSARSIESEAAGAAATRAAGVGLDRAARPNARSAQALVLLIAMAWLSRSRPFDEKRTV